MKIKELILKYKIKSYIMSTYQFLNAEMEQIVEENELEGSAEMYAKGYLGGIEDFKDYLMKSDMKFLKE